MIQLPKLKITSSILLLGLLISGCSQKTSKSLTSSNNSSNMPEKKEMEFKRLFIDASKEKILKNYDTAAALYEKCLDVDPKNDAAHYELAGLYKLKRNPKAAMSHINSSLKSDDNNKWYYLFKAALLEDQMLYNQASKVYADLVLRHESLEYYYLLATSQFFGNELKESLKTFSVIEEKYGKQEDITQQKSRIWLKLGQDEKAVQELEEYLKEGHNNPKIYQELAALLMRLDKTEEALLVFKKLEELDPDNPNVNLNLANYYKEIGDKEKSYEELKKAFYNERLDVDTKVQILLSYYTIIEFAADSTLTDQANELCEILKEIHPNEAKAYTVYGDFLFRDKKSIEALEMYSKAVELDPNRFQIWSQIVMIHLDLKDYTSMAREAERAVQYFPNQPAMFYFQGIAYAQLSNHNKAIEAYNMSKDLAIDNLILKAQVLAGLGDAYNGIEDYNNSDQAFEGALEIDSNNTHVLNNYSYFLSEREAKLDLAAKMSKRTLDLDPDNGTFLDTYAWILYKQKKYGDAKTHLEKALALGGDNSAVVVEHYGDILFKLGDKLKAIETWNKANEIGNGSKFLDKKVKDEILYE